MIGNNSIGVLLKGIGTTINFSEKHNLIHPTSIRSGDKSEAGTLEHVFSITEDSEGNIWFGDRDTGVWKYDGKSFSKIIATPSNEWKLEDNDLWLLNAYQATQKVFRFDGKTFYELTLPKPPKLTNPFEVYCIYRGKKGNIWFGTNPVGVCRYDGKSFEWITEEDVTEFHTPVAGAEVRNKRFNPY